MAKTINSDLIRGNINTIILKALYDSDRYGYDIIKEIELKSHGQYILKQPTLYSCLKRLENQGFIEAYWGEQTSNGGRRKYYRLTAEGKEIFKQSQDEYEYSRTVIDNLISDSQYDLSTLAPLENTEKDDESDTAPSPAQINDKEQNQSSQENLVEKNVLSQPQQISMDVSSLEIKSENEPLTSSDNKSDTTSKAKSEEVKTEYVQPAPVFTEKVEDPAQIPEKAENKKTETIGNETEKVFENDNSTAHKELPRINNAEYINTLLNQNSGSYFGRDREDFTEKTLDTQQAKPSDDLGDIEKRLAALKASYDKEIEFSVENQQNHQPYIASPSTQSQGIFVPKSDFSQHKQQDPQKSSNYENGFYKYNVQHSEIPTEKEEPVVYRSLSSLMATDTSTPQADEIPKPKPVSIKEQIKIRNFGKLSESIEELGENVKLRPHYDTKHDYKKQYYYRDSYLRLFHYGIMFLIMLIELFVAYIVGKQAVGANTAYDLPFYIIAIIACFILPLAAAGIYIRQPNSKKRNDYNLKSSLIFRIIIAIQLILIVYGINICMGMPITFDGKYFVTLTLPLVFIINLPISALIFNGLRKSSKFALKE